MSFKRGYTPANTCALGTERRHFTGMMRKVNNDPETQKRWAYVHVLNWTAVNGPVPQGMKLTNLGDRLDTSPNNWIAVPLGTVTAIQGAFPGGLGAAPEEIRQVIVGAALIGHELRERMKRNPETLPRTRAQAREQNCKFYFTGIACVNGHTAARRTSSHNCQGCEADFRAAQRSKAKRSPTSRQPGEH
jgi:hypothetical protein